jgi:hypothetical protein
MSATTTAPPRTSKLAMTALAGGAVAAALTTTLSFVSLVLAAVALGVGTVSWRRSPSTLAAVGMTAAAVSAYIILLEMAFVGG